jgi:hypothetical protein
VKIVAVLFACLMLSNNAFAGERPDKKLAIEYLEVSRFEQITNAMIDSYSRNLLMKFPQEEQQKLNKMLNDVLGWEGQKDQLAEIVIQVYTKRELQAAIAYMKSKLGASMTAKSEEFSNLYAAKIASNLQRFAQKHSPELNPAVKPDAMR